MIMYRKLFLAILLTVLCGFLFGCAGTLSQTADLYRASIAEERADEAYENKDYATAFAEYRNAAQAGSSYGQFMLANMYLVGEGVNQDIKQYLYWIRQAADNGSPAAHYLIGMGLIFTDPAGALRHLEKAAALEHGSSMHLLGLLHAEGIGVPQSNTEALKWFRLAQAHGIPVEDQLLSESGIQAYMNKMGQTTPSNRSANRFTRQQLVREIQQRLTDLGYAPGPVDGMFGGKTKSAIQAFQRDKRRDPDGKATLRLLEELKNSR